MHLDHTQAQMGYCIVRSERQRLSQSYFGRVKSRRAIVRKEVQREGKIRGGSRDKPHYVGGIERQSPFEQAVCLRNVVRCDALGQQSPAPKDQVRRVGTLRSLRPPSLGVHELRAERVRKTGNDFVLHVEEVGQGLVEPFRPKMMAALGVDELDADAHSVGAALNATLQNIS